MKPATPNHASTPTTAPKRGPKSWIYPAALAGIVLAIFIGFFTSNQMLYSSDQMSGFDSHYAVQDALAKQHQFPPLWFSQRLSGMPTVDALMGDLFYPVSFVINALLPIPKAISFKMIFHIFLAGLFFFLMLRRGFKTAAPLAFAGGVFYMLNPEFFSHIYPGHDGKMIVLTWLPFMVWQLKRLTEAPKPGPAVLLGIGIGMALLSSQIQSTYFVMLGLGAYTAFAFVLCLVKKEHARAFKLAGFFIVAVVVGLGIGFIQLYPSFMYVREAFSVRGVDRGFAYAASWSLHWPEVFSLWVPEFGNSLDYYWGPNFFKLNAEYAGAIVLFLAVLAVAAKSRPWRWFWAGVAVVAVLFSLGADTPFFSIAYALVPGVKKFRAPSMAMLWFSFGTILLATLFLKDLLSKETLSMSEVRKKLWTRNLLITAAVLFGVALLFSMKDLIAGLFPFISTLDSQKRQVFEANYAKNFVPMLWLWLFFTLAVIGCIIGVIQGKLKPGVALGIILLIGAIDALRVDLQFIKLVDPAPYIADDPTLQKIRGEMAAAPFRCLALPGAFQTNNAEGTHGLEGAGGFHDNELRWYREYRGDQQDRNFLEGLDKLVYTGPDGQPMLRPAQVGESNAFLDIANVKYLLGRASSWLVAIENPNALGRVSFVPNFAVMDSSLIADALRSGGYDYRTTVALEAVPQLRPAQQLTDSAARQLPVAGISWQRYSANDRIVKVNAPADGFLRISEVYYPGWKIAVDGKDSPYYRSDLAFMAIYLPKGEHVVEMKPHSLFLAKAAHVTLVTVIALAVYGLIALALFLNKRKSARAASPESGK